MARPRRRTQPRSSAHRESALVSMGARTRCNTVIRQQPAPPSPPRPDATPSAVRCANCADRPDRRCNLRCRLFSALVPRAIAPEVCPGREPSRAPDVQCRPPPSAPTRRRAAAPRASTAYVPGKPAVRAGRGPPPDLRASVLYPSVRGAARRAPKNRHDSRAIDGGERRSLPRPALPAHRVSSILCRSWRVARSAYRSAIGPPSHAERQESAGPEPPDEQPCLPTASPARCRSAR